MAIPEAQVVHRALDGRRYQLSGPLDLSAPVTSVAELSISGRRYEFTAGGAGLGDDVIEALGAEYDEELSYSGGALSTVRTRPYDPKIRLREDRLTGVWRGRGFSFFCHMYHATSTDLIGVLREVKIREYDDGLAITPYRPHEFAGPATLAKEVPGLGLLEISPLTPQHTAQLPTWRGLSTQAGELFSDELSDGSPYFLLAGADTWVTVLPLHDTAVDQVPELVGQLRLRTAA
ncbi:MAG: hypothetical protein ACRDTU_22420 [Micromonosporaceae bacterium]